MHTLCTWTPKSKTSAHTLTATVDPFLPTPRVRIMQYALRRLSALKISVPTQERSFRERPKPGN